jgi:elongation factor 2
VLPAKGSVAFGSGKECWAFTITKFARFYSAKFKTDYNKLMDKFWGDNYFDAGAKKWVTEGQDE